MVDAAISIKNLSKTYKLYESPQDRLKEALDPFRRKYHRDFHALDDVSFDILKGETVGIIGQNGAGKSTLLKIVTGVIAPTSGSVTVDGKISALLELGAGFNPQISGLENVYFNGTLMGFSKEDIDARLDDILSFADIGDFIHQPVRTYSSGMFVRLAFAVAVHVDPEILIVDEALSVGDMMFQAKCYDRIKAMMADGVTTLFVTHNMNTVTALCNAAYLLDNGKIYAKGDPKDVTLTYYKLQREREHIRQSGQEIPKAEPRITAPTDAIAKPETPSGEKQFGIGTATITGYKIFNHEGNETLALETSKRFKVTMDVFFNGEVANPCFGMMIRNLQGQNLLGVHSYHERRMDLGLRKSGDQVKVSFECEMLLNPGRYLLSLGISEHVTDLEYTNIHAKSNTVALTVYGKEFAFGIIHNEGTIAIENAQHSPDNTSS